VSEHLLSLTRSAGLRPTRGCDTSQPQRVNVAPNYRNFGK
jgi:hypothetical protein